MSTSASRVQVAAIATAPVAGSSDGFWSSSVRRLRNDRLGMISLGILLLLAVLALLAPLISALITQYDPTDTDFTSTFAPPQPGHWLGTDDLGRDTLTRLIWGGRVSLGVGFLAVAIQLTVGTTVGLLAGFYGGWIDEVLMRLTDVVLAFPAIFLFILMSSLLRPSPVTLALIIASVAWAGVARLIRGEVLALRQREFITASRAVGVSNRRLMLGHLLPNAVPILIVAATLAVGQIILVQAALDFLGLGIQPPTPSWGNMLSKAQTFYSRSVWLVVVPGIAIFVTVLCANFLGNALRDAFDTRLADRRL